MRFPLIGKNGSIFIGNLRLFWIYFDRLMGTHSWQLHFDNDSELQTAVLVNL
jgi:hypothetical protein